MKIGIIHSLVEVYVMGGSTKLKAMLGIIEVIKIILIIIDILDH